MDPTMGNPSSDTGVSDNNGTESSLKDIMGSMTASNPPEAEPGQTGDKEEGKENSQSNDMPAWTSQLPEEIRSNADIMKQLTKFGKIGDLAKSYSELESKLGKTIEKPGKDSKPEDIEAFYRKLGKPESSDKYSIDDKNAAAFKELAYKCNLTDEQAKSVYEGVQEISKQYLANAQDSMLRQVKETEETLRREYGNNAQMKLDLCKRGVIAFGGAGLGKKLEATGLLYDIDVVKMFIKLGEMNAEAGSVLKTASGTQAYKSTSEGGSFEFKGI